MSLPDLDGARASGCSCQEDARTLPSCSGRSFALRPEAAAGTQGAPGGCQATFWVGRRGLGRPRVQEACASLTGCLPLPGGLKAPGVGERPSPAPASAPPPPRNRRPLSPRAGALRVVFIPGCGSGRGKQVGNHDSGG